MMRHLAPAIVLVALLVVLVLVLKTSGTQSANVPTPVIPFVNPYAWRSIGRGQVLNTTIALPRIQTWTVQRSPSLNGLKSRFTLAGRFAGSEPVFFFVLDPTNAARMAAGSPPLIEYQSTGVISTSYPEAGSAWGFVRPVAPQPRGLPMNTTDLALRIVAKLADSYRPPAQVTAEIYVDGECFCTEAQATRLRPH